MYSNLYNYRKLSNIKHTKSQNLNVPHLVLQLSFAQSIEARCYVENEDVVGAEPTGDGCSNYIWVINNFQTY